MTTPATFCIASTLHSGNAAGRKLLESLLPGAPDGWRACYLGCYHDDDPDWAKVTIDYFQKKLGHECFWPRLTDPDLDMAAACRMIDTADVLYLDGGDTLAGVEHTRQRGLLGAMKRVKKHAHLVFGVSGGACAAGPYTIGYADDEEPFLAPCYDMGIPLPLDVHDEKEDWPEMRALLELAAKDPKIKKAAGICIPTGSALIMTPREELLAHGKLGVEERSLDAKGGWKIKKYPPFSP
jgi:hypothetical protein